MSTDALRVQQQAGSIAPTRHPVRVDSDLYEAVLRIADMRSETVDDVVVRALRKYARGRTRPRD